MFFSIVAAYVLDNDLLDWRGLFRYYSIGGLVVLLTAYGFHHMGDGSERELNPEVIESVDDLTATDEERMLLMQTEPALPSPPPTPTSVSSKSSVTKRRAGFALLFSNSLEGQGVRYLFVSHMLSNAPTNVFLKYSVVFIENFTNNDTLITYIVPVILGIGTMMARIGIDMNPFAAFKVVHIGGFLFTLLLLIVDVSNPHDDDGYENYFTVAVVLTVYFFIMLTTGMVYPLISLRTVAVEGKQNHLLNTSVQYVANGIGIIVFGYLGGVCYDYGDFDGLWIFIMAIYLTAFIWDEIYFYEESLSKQYSLWFQKAVHS
jgi:hypothetical protein